MDYNMRVTEAMQMREDLKSNIESMILIYSSATGLEMEVNASSDIGKDGSVTVGAHVVVCLPDKSPLAKDVSTG